MNLCNYNMNFGLLGMAKEMRAKITGFEEYGTHYKNKTFCIDIERTPFYITDTDIDFNWTTVKNKDVLFVSGIDFNTKIEPIIYHFYVFASHPKIYKYPKIELYFNPSDDI